MRYKLLAIDIDDTILPRLGSISERTKRAVSRAREEGIFVTIATGRGYMGSSKVLRELDITGLVINYGGAMINDAVTGEPVIATELESSTVVEIIGLAESLGLHVHLYQGDEIVCEHEHEYGRLYAEHLGIPARIEPNIRNMVWKNVPKVLVITEPERVPELLEFFQKRLEGKAAVSASSPGFIEFNKIGASKGSALRQLAEYLGVPREQTAAIGDNTLDLDMIEWAGLGCCVEDGSDAVKAAADVIAPPCREDGAAWFIENYLLEGSDFEASLSLGFDIGGTTVKGGALDGQMNILRKLARPTPKGDAAALCDLIRDMAKELLGGAKAKTVGVTVPGSVGPDGGILDAWNIGLRSVPLKKMIEERITAEKIVVKNDADAAACAELRFGALQGVTTGLMLTLGTGVGGSLILGGELFHGGLGRGTELGHAMLDRGGRKCGCGKSGCIETLCSASALRRMAEGACRDKKGMMYELFQQGCDPDAKLLIDCAMSGDETAIALFEDYTDALSDAIASFVNVLDPEVIVIGGGVSGAGDFLLDKLRSKVPPRTFFGSCGRFAAATAGNDAGILGSIE